MKWIKKKLVEHHHQQQLEAKKKKKKSKRKMFIMLYSYVFRISQYLLNNVWSEWVLQQWSPIHVSLWEHMLIGQGGRHRQYTFYHVLVLDNLKRSAMNCIAIAINVIWAIDVIEDYYMDDRLDKYKWIRKARRKVIRKQMMDISPTHSIFRSSSAEEIQMCQEAFACISDACSSIHGTLKYSKLFWMQWLRKKNY